MGEERYWECADLPQSFDDMIKDFVAKEVKAAIDDYVRGIKIAAYLGDNEELVISAGSENYDECKTITPAMIVNYREFQECPPCKDMPTEERNLWDALNAIWDRK